jgi:hypothetical protein
MSIRIMAKVWDGERFSGSALLVLLAMADYANDAGICWPSVGSLARKARISERTVQRVVDHLVAEGAVEIVRQGGGSGNSNRYRVIAEGCQGDTLLADTEAPQVGIDGGEDGGRVTSATAKGDTAMSPDPSLNPPRASAAKKRGDLVDGMIAYARAKAPPTFKGVPENVRGVIGEAIKAHTEIFDRLLDAGARAAWIKWANGWVEKVGEGVGDLIEDAARMHKSAGLAYMGPWSLDWAITKLIFDPVDPATGAGNNHLRPFGVIIE